MALLSNTLMPSSSIAGTLAFGLTARYSGLNWSPSRVSTATGSIGEAGFLEEERDLGRVGRSVEVEFEHLENLPLLLLPRKSGRGGTAAGGISMRKFLQRAQPTSS